MSRIYVKDHGRLVLKERCNYDQSIHDDKILNELYLHKAESTAIVVWFKRFFKTGRTLIPETLL